MTSANAALKWFVGACFAVAALAALPRGGISWVLLGTAAILNFAAAWKSHPSRSPVLRALETASVEHVVVNKVGLGTESSEAVLQVRGGKPLRVHLAREEDRLAFIALVSKLCPQALVPAPPSAT